MPTGSRLPISVVVATRDRPEHLARCLRALAREVGAADEVIVVDSASRDGTAVREVAAAAPQGIRCRYLRAPRPGTSLARNLGWAAAATSAVAFVDDDVEVLAGWAEEIAGAFADPAVAFVTGWIGVPPHQADVAEPNPLMVAPTPFHIDRHRRGLLGASANFAARCDALAAVGGFDERLGPGTWISAGEDHELFDRLLAAGYTGCYRPSARVEHDQWRTRRESFGLHWRIGKGAGARLARLAHRDPSRFAAVSRELLVDDIAHALVGSVRAGYQTGTVFALLRLAGLLVGWLSAPVRALFGSGIAGPRP